jgi:RimJ/RimL family protein N-acetyltransferase
LRSSAEQWRQWPAGPCLIRLRSDGQLIGGTGFGFETSDRAITGYVLAEDAWGKGYATEALAAIVDVAPRIGVARLYALCHPEHRASWRVLEKCGFTCEGRWSKQVEFPNLAPGVLQDVLCYAMIFQKSGADQD